MIGNLLATFVLGYILIMFLGSVHAGKSVVRDLSARYVKQENEEGEEDEESLTI